MLSFQTVIERTRLPCNTIKLFYCDGAACQVLLIYVLTGASPVSITPLSLRQKHHKARKKFNTARFEVRGARNRPTSVLQGDFLVEDISKQTCQSHVYHPMSGKTAVNTEQTANAHTRSTSNSGNEAFTVALAKTRAKFVMVN